MTSLISRDLAKQYHASYVEQILKWDKAYYIDAQPLVPDAKYDAIFRQLRQLEQEHPWLVNPRSPTQKVSGGLSEAFAKVKHVSPMISLYTETDFGLQGAQSFIQRLTTYILKNELPFSTANHMVAEPKYDGLAIDLKYVGGVFTQALTRGDGDTGEDVTHTVRTIANIPTRLPKDTLSQVPSYEPIVHVRGEVLMPKETFARINAQKAESGHKPYVNPRNAAAGTLRQLDPEEAARNGLIFIAYGFGNYESFSAFTKDILPTHWDALQSLKLSGFFVAPEVQRLNYPSASELFAYHQLVMRDRSSLPYEIDGVVYKLDGMALQKALGEVSREPRWAVAHKFNPEEATTRLQAIDVQVGRTGQITPVARLQPVFVGGTTVTNVTLHNLFEVRRRNVRPGDDVVVRRAGDVIPEILKNTQHRLPFLYQPNFRMPRRCPECASLVTRAKGATKHYCTAGWLCPAQRTQRLIHFGSRKAMDIRGLGDSAALEFVTKYNLQRLSQLYELREEDLVGMGWGEKTTQNLIDAIDKSREPSLERFIYALGIETVGLSTARLLANTFGSLSNLMATDVPTLVKIKDVGEETARCIVAFFQEERNQIEMHHFQNSLRIQPVPIQAFDEAHVFFGKKVAVTGSFMALSRKDLEQAVQACGGTITGSITKKTDYLIAGLGGGEKRTKAAALGVKVLDEGLALPFLGR